MDWFNPPQKDNESLQGSNAWMTFRGKGLGSSDAPVIMGVSPWKTLHELYLEKIGEGKKFEGNWATRRGQDLEPIARGMYEKIRGHLFTPSIGTHPNNEVFRASYDGINHTLKQVIEIKCPGKESHQKALLGIIPEVYYPQCQWLLMVSGYEDLDYISWDGESQDLVIIPVKADKVYQEDMAAKARMFWLMVQSRNPIFAPVIKQDKELVQTLKLREELKSKIDILTLEYEQLNHAIKERSPMGGNYGMYSIKWTEFKGSVDYSKIEVLKEIDLNPYRKPSTYRMSVTKNGS